MKRKGTASFALLCYLLISCWHHGNNITIQYRESQEYYSMDAWFNEARTKAVENYMDDEIGRRSNISFARTRIDGRIGLDDHTTFFIEKSPGHLKIKLDKRENSADNYRKIKNLCEGIKEVVK